MEGNSPSLCRVNLRTRLWANFDILCLSNHFFNPLQSFWHCEVHPLLQL